MTGKTMIWIRVGSEDTWKEAMALHADLTGDTTRSGMIDAAVRSYLEELQDSSGQTITIVA